MKSKYNGKKTKSPLTITWPDTLVAFIKGPVFDKTRIKPAQLSELAMEDWLKKHGYWDEYQNTLAGGEIKVISNNDNDVPVIKGDKKIDPTSLFGIWANKPRSLESIRKDAWQRKADIR